MENITKIKGFADIFDDDARRFLFLETTARRVFGNYGFSEMRTPLLERTELFARSIGQETDVVSKEMYTFDDRKGRSLTLRPEATAGVMRSFIENKIFTRESVSRFYTMGPMFRYERPQKGRMRQFHQINAECIGPVEPMADAEVILMLMAFTRELGLKGLTLQLNSLGDPQCRPAYHQALRDYLQALDKSDLCPDCQRRLETNPLRVLDCKQPGCQALVSGAPSILEHLCGPCSEHFARVREYLDAAGQTYVLNPRLVRGLDYYVRTTFEIVSGDIGAQSSVAGGGRYDGLIRDLGGPDAPGVGFACGMERLALLLPELAPEKPDFYLAVLDESALPAALALALALRDSSFSGEASYEAKSVKSQMRQAGKRQARFTLFFGSSELSGNTVTVKDMESGEQTTIPRSQLLDHLKKPAGN